jgi:hypothetical protein
VPEVCFANIPANVGIDHAHKASGVMSHEGVTLGHAGAALVIFPIIVEAFFSRPGGTGQASAPRLSGTTSSATGICARPSRSSRRGMGRSAPIAVNDDDPDRSMY